MSVGVQDLFGGVISHVGSYTNIRTLPALLSLHAAVLSHHHASQRRLSVGCTDTVARGYVTLASALRRSLTMPRARCNNEFFTVEGDQ